MQNRLTQLLEGLDATKDARNVSDLTSEGWWDVHQFSVPAVPPENVLQQSIKDLFGDGSEVQPAFMTEHVSYKVCTLIMHTLYGHIQSAYFIVKTIALYTGLINVHSRL